MAADDKPSRSHHTPRRAASQSRASRPRRRSPRQQEAEPPPEAEPEEALQCAVVGIGASAGGLEALQEFFSAMPADSGLAFVVVTHMHPEHRSLLPELLARCTDMPVQEIAESMPARPNQVYVAAPGTQLAIMHGTLQPMSDDEPQQPPIDYFLRTLAEDKRQRAIGIVLSGAGSDGALGLQAIKGNGGLTLTQDEREAKFPGMPHQAQATGLVDHVLPAAQMPQALIDFVDSEYVQGEETRRSPLTEDLLRQIFVLLRERAKNDFSAYKTTTIRRRIERRMQVNRLDTPQDYLQFLRDHPPELDVLFRDLLITVTSFFRDSEAFEVLANQALPELLERRPEHRTIRVWVPACATGEEAYSLAMVLQECMERLGTYFRVQIFATDLDGQSIQVARTGTYPKSIVHDVSQTRLERFFTHEEDCYVVKPEIREMVVFAPHNVLSDPPFTKLDLLSCRNLLIYLNTEMQRQLLPIFHYALLPQGLLFLGTSETIGSFTELFETVDARWKIYRRQESSSAPTRPTFEFPLQAAARPPLRGSTSMVASRASSIHLGSAMEHLLLQRFAPPSVLVNDRGDVAYIHGFTGMFLQPAPGPAGTQNVFTMAREGLRAELVTALRQAMTTEDVVQRRAEVKTNGGLASVELTVQAISQPESMHGLYLVTFRPLPAPVERRPRHGGATASPDRIHALEEEVKHLRQALQSSMEESETVNEELKSANEELQSTNEELQSSNEELETAKEEMQSLNEELQTVNAELQEKVDTLGQANDDMKNLLNSTDIATLFLDTELRIKRFTPQATQVFKLIPSDIGRPISDLVSYLSYDRLEDDAREVLRTLALKELEVSTREGGWYAVRITPYRTTENVIDGVVVTFVDISRLKDSEQRIANLRLAESIVQTVREPLVVLDAELRVVSANRAFSTVFGIDPEQVVRHLLYELGEGAWDISALRQRLERVLPDSTTMNDFEIDHDFPRLGRKMLRLNASRLEGEGGQEDLILLAIEDVTDRSAR